MANDGWEISIQVLDDALQQQVDPSHELHQDHIASEPLLSASGAISQYEIIGINKDPLAPKGVADQAVCAVEIKHWQLLSSLCRLCAQESPDVVQIFDEEGLGLRLPEIISSCLPIKITRGDALPQVVCRACVAALHQSHVLLTTVKKADNDLRRILGQSSVEYPDHFPQESSQTEAGDPKKPICDVCKQHFAPIVSQPHVIRIGTTSNPQLPQTDFSHIDFIDAGDDEKIFPEESADDFPARGFSKPRRKYNTRKYEEPPMLKESKLRPRKKGKVPAKKIPVKERLPAPEINCNLCTGIFHRKELYVKHYLVQHKLYLCNECDQSFERHEDLSSHSFEAHDSVIPPERYHHPPGAPPVCTFCSKEFKSISGLCHHVDSLHLKIPGNFLCNQCGKPFYGKKKLELHMMRHTGIKTVMCQDCGKMFYNEGTLKIHSEMHSMQRKYKCSHIGCDKTFKHWRNLYAHMHTVHGRKWNYACNACPQSFKTSSEAAEHYTSHSPEEQQMNGTDAPFTKMSPYECKICFKHYNSQLHYTNHMKTHENPATADSNARNFECPTCFKRFKSKHYLKIHLGVHMTMKPFCCQYCGKSFITKMLLQTHERIHTNETPFRCEVCGKGFRAQKKLQIHKRDVHDKIKNFVCPTCGKAFSRKNHLDAHIRTHTNERPYQCDICGQGFKQVGDMRRHVARHQTHPQSQPLYKSPPHFKSPYKQPDLPEPM